MEFSLPGLIGIVVGVAAGVISYVMMFSAIERKLQKFKKLHPAPEPMASDNGMAVTRRITLATYVVLFGALGYWFGSIWN